MKLVITKIGIPTIKNTRNGVREGNYLFAKEYGQRHLSFLVEPWSKSLKVGDIVDGKLEIVRVNEKEYYNLTIFKP